ncbi:MAG TPA: creatininase family protein [Candidatus Acidoferrum sp.]|nr:creatininase family protein [Candidatus Acidoferrum sp.]
MRFCGKAIACISLCFFLSSAPLKAQQVSSRLMDDLNWMEFKQLVPAKINTVILTVGTLEAHGFINNGADNTVPIALAKAIAPDLNALIAPHIPYGITGILAPYPGSLHIPEEPFRNYVRAVLLGLVSNGFKNIIILNGHGPQVGTLQELAEQISLEHKVNTLVINWWILTADVTKEVFGEDGGHATNNETAMVQAIDPKLVHWDLYTGKDMATALPSPSDGWSATPFPSTILLYTEGQGLPKDRSQAKAEEYYQKVVARVKAVAQDTLHKWAAAGFN